MPGKVILIFIDGLGIPEKVHLSKSPLNYDLKILKGEKFYSKSSNGFFYGGLDAQMHVPGLPQSATGQASIYTGINTQKLLNQHIFAYPTNKLISLLFERSLFSRLKKINKKASFINAYTKPYFKILNDDFGIDGINYEIKDINSFIGNIRLRHRFSATTIQNLSINNPFYTINDILMGRSIYHDIDGHTLLRHNIIPSIISRSMVQNAFLYNISNYDLILFEYFLTDIYGHKQDYELSVKSLITLDDLIYDLSMILDKKKHSIIVVSDHGNIEDLSRSSHTLNKAIFLYWGDSISKYKIPEQLSDISDFILELMK